MSGNDGLLEQIRATAGAAGLKHAEPREDKGTYARGALLHEIMRPGRELRSVDENEASKGHVLTLQRGGFLHELRSKRSAATSEPASQRTDGDDTAAGEEFEWLRKCGWLHKRAQNGIWQKRYFVLTREALSYFHKLPSSSSSRASRVAEVAEVKAALKDKDKATCLSLEALHDPHPVNGAEFFVYCKERQVRLRAGSAAEAASWVGAIVQTKLDLGQEVSEKDTLREDRLAGLFAPTLSLSLHNLREGGVRAASGLAASLAEAARLLGEPEETTNAIKEGAAEVEEAGGPQGTLLSQLRGWGVHEGRIVQLLRWSHPTVLQPALDSISDNLIGRLSYTIDKDSWDMRIDFDAADTSHVASVHHFLWAEAVCVRANLAVGEAPPAGEPVRFRFLVELTLHFLLGTVDEIVDQSLNVVDYEFPLSSERILRDEAKTALKPLVLPHLEYMQIWRRPLHRLPVHKDVPRLLKGMLIVGASGEDVYRDDGTARPAIPSSQTEALWKLMLGLSRKPICLDSAAIHTLVEQKFSEYLTAETSDVAASLRSFLLESGLPEEALSVQVLKCIHQEMIFPAVLQLRNSIYSVIPYKDIKGEWRVLVEIRSDQIIISHKKWEQAHNDNPVNYFTFRWCVSLVFDRRMRNMRSATLSVLDFEMGSASSDEHKRVVLAVLKPWLAPGVLYKQVWDGLGEVLLRDSGSSG